MSKSVKRNSKATLFERLFNEKPFTLQLYRTLHPEDVTTTENDIKVISLSKTFTTGIYNDLGFLVKDKLMVLVEAQSTWSPTITLRMLFYLADSWLKWIKANKISLYSTTRLEIPSPELYVIYCKDDHYDKDLIRLSDEFFGKENPFVAVNAKVLRYDGSNTIVDQYICFCQKLDENIKMFGREGTKAIEKTIKYCKEHGILTDFLIGREEELMDISDILFNQDWEDEVMLYNAQKKGEEIGRDEAKTSIAFKMLKDNLPFEVIVKYSGLTLEQVTELAK